MLWKTSKELKLELHNYVILVADEIYIEIRQNKEEQKIKVNNTDLCMH